MPLDILLEGLLFYKSQPLKKATLIKEFGITEADFAMTLKTLHTRLEQGALRLLETDTDIELVTAPSLAPFIEGLRKADIKADIGKAGAETLAIILYRGPIGRSEIDRIRGVNSSFILRNLLVRGLIDRQPAKKGQGYSFIISSAFYKQLGITDKHSLPDFSRVADALEDFAVVSSETESV